jgi:hypothetical protein
MQQILSEEILDNIEEHLEMYPWISLTQLSQDTGAAVTCTHSHRTASFEGV